jgi:hypothetical protein
MSKIVIVIIIYPRHKPTDLIYDYVYTVYKTIYDFWNVMF